VTTVAELVRAGRLVTVEPDPESAAERVAVASRHLEAAVRVADIDPDGAYALAYDAARKAVTAHMLAAGYRVRGGRPGAHEAVAQYATAALGSGPYAEDVGELDRMRRTRNRSEYGERPAPGASELRADMARARAIVAAVEASWPTVG
jgi:YD repeat-containing protein